ncbi:MAG: phosphoribosylformylglycinamidine synthase I [Chloroflexota bacterium]
MVLLAPGINCDRETIEACRMAGATVEAVHLNQLMDGQRSLLDYSFLLLAGGFSYGDHLGAGSMLATILRHQFLGDIQRFVDDGRPILGICNGFQVLSRLGLLGDVALVPNASGRFECRWVSLDVHESSCIFLRDLLDSGRATAALELPVAHGEGRVVVPEDALADVLPYAPLRYREDLNGSVGGIAGVCNPAGNVFGLMPHPERYLTRLQHPEWQRRTALPPAGLELFRSAVAYVRRGL